MDIIDEIGLSEKAFNFIKNTLKQFDTTLLSRIAFKKTVRFYWGWCYYPTKTIPTYRITVAANVGIKNYQTSWYVETAPFTPNEELMYVVNVEALKKDLERESWRLCEIRGTGFKVRDAKILLRNYHDAIVLVFGHELYHFLTKTRQIKGRNTQTAANKFGVEMLEKFREGEQAFGLFECPICIDCEVDEHEDLMELQ